MRVQTRQSGVAVVTALLVVALATLAVTGVMWRQQVQARSVENQIALAETRWLARGAIDWARVMLVYNARQSPGRDDLTQFWAVPIAETKIADSENSGLSEGYLSGQITDEAGKLNLFELAHAGQPVTDLAVIAKFDRLFGALSLDAAGVDAIAAAVARTQPRLAGDGKTLLAPLDLPMLVVDDLARVPGVDVGMVERLRPHVTFLPTADGQSVKVNANTASVEVLYATIPSFSLQDAQTWAAMRERGDYLRSPADLQSRFAKITPSDTNMIAVGSNYFRVQGRIHYDRVFMNLQALVYRAANGAYTQVLWEQEN